MSNNKITLNVRGTIIIVGKSTLEQLDYFKTKLKRLSSGELKTPSETQNEIFVDCDYKIFNHILNFLTIPKYDVPDKYLHNVQASLDFYSPKKFTIKKTPKATFVHNKFLLPKHINSYSQENRNQISFEHAGILTFFCKFYCDNSCDPKFILKLSDAHNSYEFYKTNNDSNIFYYYVNKGKIIFNIPYSIIYAFEEKLCVQFIPIENNCSEENTYCSIYVTYYKKKI